jgi:hypothetical protein
MLLILFAPQGASEVAMANEELLTQVRSRQAAHLRACFPTLTERDLLQILGSKPPQAVYVLQQRFGCDVEDAKAAWNDFVLRYIDGPQTADALPLHLWENGERLC